MLRYERNLERDDFVSWTPMAAVPGIMSTQPMPKKWHSSGGSYLTRECRKRSIIVMSGRGKGAKGS
ncbi:hypothetical protein KIN20_006345 [Parelaphostrongylus tenuis]|uniref:Uncharacterized protein n=1 Tax=Parelaphostrongylus tenuis TaxID=148309 RepID=A0AAD5M3G9_PARTN|nr:hypothetical protein KIN20_006345 [Parelaphostrongylus tenuis]